MFRSALAHCEKLLVKSVDFVSRQVVPVVIDLIDAASDKRPASAGGKPKPATGSDLTHPVVPEDVVPEDATRGVAEAAAGSPADDSRGDVSAEPELETFAPDAVTVPEAAAQSPQGDVPIDDADASAIAAVVPAAPATTAADAVDTAETAAVVADVPDVSSVDVVPTSSVSGKEFVIRRRSDKDNAVSEVATLVVSDRKGSVKCYLRAGSRIRATWMCKPMNTAPEKIHPRMTAYPGLLSVDVGDDGMRTLLRDIEVSGPGLAASLVIGGGTPAKRWVNAAGKPVTDLATAFPKRDGTVSFDDGGVTVTITGEGVTANDAA